MLRKNRGVYLKPTQNII